jgi:hypothetical protein
LQKKICKLQPAACPRELMKTLPQLKNAGHEKAVEFCYNKYKECKDFAEDLWDNEEKIFMHNDYVSTEDEFDNSSLGSDLNEDNEPL